MFHFKHNLPAWERLLRLFLAGLIATAAWAIPGLGTWMGAAGLAAAALLAVTAFIGFCPACAMLGRKAS